MPSLPLSNRSASIVPGTAAGTPQKGVPPFELETVNVAMDSFVPPVPSARSVYVVVAEGETLVEPAAPTLPTDGLMATCVAELVLHDSVADPPGVMDDGE